MNMPMNKPTDGASPTGNVEHYKKDSETYDYFPKINSELGQFERRRSELLIRCAGLQKQPRSAFPPLGEWIVDLGMGGGQLIRLLADRGFTPLGFDIAWRNCKNVLERRFVNDDQGQSTCLAAADVYFLPLPVNSVRVAFLSEVLEHLTHPEDALREVGRVVRPAGTVVASCPWNETIVHHLCIHCNRLTPAHAHLHSVTQQLMEQWLRAGGFRLQRIVYFNHKLLHYINWSRWTRRLPFAVWRAGDVSIQKLWFKPSHFAVIASRC